MIVFEIIFAILFSITILCDAKCNYPKDRANAQSAAIVKRPFRRPIRTAFRQQALNVVILCDSASAGTPSRHSRTRVTPVAVRCGSLIRLFPFSGTAVFWFPSPM
jgi:hypothetical protein